MKDRIKKFFLKRRPGIMLVVVLLAMIPFSVSKVYSASGGAVQWYDKTMPEDCSSLSVNDRSEAYLTKLNNGYMRVFYNDGKIGIEYYDNEFNLTKSGNLDMELSMWGGFYAGSDGYYIAEGKSNTGENDSAEVIRIIHYDKNWNRVGAASITGNTALFGGEVRYPFKGGSGSMCEYGNKLYLTTGHEGYVDEAYGQGHQGFLLIEVNKSTLTGRIIQSDLSHSFTQIVKPGSDGIYIYEQNEGSRCTCIRKYDPDTGTRIGPFSVLDYGGKRTSAWAIPCYSTVDGLELSSNNALGLGTSIDQTQYDNYSSSMPYNIYLTVTPRNNFNKESTHVKWLTNYSGNGKRFYGAHITKITDNKFLILWQEGDKSPMPVDEHDQLSEYKLHYMFVDGAGNIIGSEKVVDAPISDCAPVLSGNDVVYYAANTNTVDFYTINTSDGGFSKKTYRVAGPNATWDIENGELTVSGTGDLTFQSYDLNARSKAGVKKIIVEEGIKSICSMCFIMFNNLVEAEVGDGVESIGDRAFFYNDYLRKITLPSSVTSIGKDVLWTGATWTSDSSHVTLATIYAKCDSYAIQYAKDNNIKYNSEHVLEADYTIDKQPACTAVGSKSIHCSICGEKTNATAIPATGHSLGEWEEAFPSTCVEEGQLARKCSKCDYVETKAIDPKGHNFTAGTPSNNKVAMTCTVCGHTESANVPTGIAVFWRTASSGSYYGYIGDIYPEQNLSVYIQPQYEDASYPRLDDFIIDTGDGRQMDLYRALSYTYDEPGTYTVTIYPKLAPKVKAIETIRVLDPNAPEVTEPDPGTDPGGSGNQSDYSYDDNDYWYWYDYEEDTSRDQKKTQKGSDGTPLGKGASIKAAEKAITGMTNDADPAGTAFSVLTFRSTKQTNSALTLKWAHVPGASKYYIYGNKCGTSNRMMKQGVFTGTSLKVSSVIGNDKQSAKLTKGTYYKFIVVAADRNNKVISASKIIHVSTKGGKTGNYKSVKTKAKKNKVSLKVGKKFKLKAKGIAQSRKLKVKVHRKIIYETTDSRIAAVSSNGVIKSVSKGTCYVYAYSQSGTYARIKVTVK